MTQYLLEKLEVDFEIEVFDVAQNDDQSENQSGNVGHGLGLQVPDDVEFLPWEPAAPQHEAHDDDGQHAVENGEDAVLLEEQQTLYVGAEIEDERE